jgi:hypothetical protein
MCAQDKLPEITPQIRRRGWYRPITLSDQTSLPPGERQAARTGITNIHRFRTLYSTECLLGPLRDICMTGQPLWRLLTRVLGLPYQRVYASYC